LESLCFYSCSSLFRYLLCSGIFGCTYTMLNLNPPPLHFLILFPYPVLFNSFQCISLCLVPTQM
jgi:hypothetical protein